MFVFHTWAEECWAENPTIFHSLVCFLGLMFSAVEIAGLSATYVVVVFGYDIVQSGSFFFEP